jgi:hypothetical protein
MRNATRDAPRPKDFFASVDSARGNYGHQRWRGDEQQNKIREKIEEKQNRQKIKNKKNKKKKETQKKNQ